MPAPPPAPSWLAGLGQEVSATILRPAGLLVLRARRALLAIADDRDPARGHAAGEQVVHRRLRAPLAERDVVLRRPALVAVALDQDEPVGVLLEPGRGGVKDPRVFRTDLVLVVVEMNVLELTDRLVLTGHDAGAAHRRRAPRPRRRSGRPRPRDSAPARVGVAPARPPRYPCRGRGRGSRRR